MSAKAKRERKEEEPSFEEALARLEEIAQKLESGDLPLEESIALAEEGIKLSQLCEQQLTAAEGKIHQLVERLGQAELQPLETEAGGEEDDED